MRAPTLIATATAVVALAACGTGEDPSSPAQTEPPPTATDPDRDATDGTTPDATPRPTAAPEPDASPTARPTGEPGNGTSDDVAAMTFTDCAAERYTVGYPADWNANEADEHTGACEIFHPGEIDLPEQPQDRDLHYAVSMYVDPVDYDDVRTRDGTGEELERRETTVDGRDALVREVRSTGEGLTPEGELRYSYTVDLDGEILVAVTHTVGDTDYERDKAVLDRMLTEELTVSAG